MTAERRYAAIETLNYRQPTKNAQMIYFIFGGLAVVAFLIVLTGFLRGAKKAQINAVLSLVLLGLLATAFFVLGWKLGLMAIAIAFFSAIFTRPLAARLASKLLATSTGAGSQYVGLPPRPLQKISKQLGQQVDPSKLVKEMLSGGARRAEAEDALLAYCESQPDIQILMKEFRISRDDLKELYHQLIAEGAGQWACGHWVPASALAYPDALRYLLVRRGESIKETASDLIMYFERGSALASEKQEPVTRRSAGRAMLWFPLLALIIAGVLMWYTPSKNKLPTSQPTATPQVQRKFVYVTGDVVNIREGPSTRFPVVAKVNRGRKLVELTREKDWVKIELDERNGKSAWIHSSLVSAEPRVRSEDWITILTAENRARLCPRPNCGQDQELLRIPTNTKLRILGTRTVSQPAFNVTWYKVKYQRKEGWISEFNTNKARKP